MIYYPVPTRRDKQTKQTKSNRHALSTNFGDFFSDRQRPAMMGRETLKESGIDERTQGIFLQLFSESAF